MVHATAHSAPNSQPAQIRKPRFDAFIHAQYFTIDALKLVPNGKGYPQLRFETNSPAGFIAAGTITHVPAAPATMRGSGYSASIAVTGRMAELSEPQRLELQSVGVRFLAEQGTAKTFYTAFIPEPQAGEVAARLLVMKNGKGNPCAHARFTGNAIGLFQRMLAQRTVEQPPF